MVRTGFYLFFFFNNFSVQLWYGWKFTTSIRTRTHAGVSTSRVIMYFIIFEKSNDTRSCQVFRRKYYDWKNTFRVRVFTAAALVRLLFLPSCNLPLYACNNIVTMTILSSCTRAQHTVLWRFISSTDSYGRHATNKVITLRDPRRRVVQQQQ